jgi:hypothetical protein
MWWYEAFERDRSGDTSFTPNRIFRARYSPLKFAARFSAWQSELKTGST